MTILLNIKERLAIFPYAQLFLSLSIVFGTWVIYIPSIIEKLNMSEAQLGIALFFSAFGAVVSLLVGKKITVHYGEGRVSFYTIILVAIFISSLFVAPTYHWLCVAMFLFGFSSGVMQIGINTLVATLERERKMVIMSTCHGFFSLGAMLSAGFGTLLIILINDPLIHISIALSLVILLQLYYRKRFYYIATKPPESKNHSTKSVLKNTTLWGIAAIAVIGMVSEGAIADWSGLYLKDVALTKPEYLGLGYAGFSLSMTIGRLSGDYFNKKYGAWQIIFVTYLIAFVGFAIVLVGHPILSVFGFFVIGMGFSIIVPEVYRLSANIEGVNPSSGIAFMAGSGYVGFLSGPVVLGFLAEEYGLRISFALLFMMTFMGILMILIMRKKR